MNFSDHVVLLVLLETNMTLKPLLGQRALITGGSKGIGGGIASTLASLGCHVTLLSRKVETLNTKVAELNHRYPNARPHTSVSFDLSRSSELELFAKSQLNLDAINILVNCAGQTQRKLLVATPVQEIISITNVNVTSPIILSKLFLKAVARSKTANPHIVNISSVVANYDVDLVGATVYGASKAALLKFSNTLQQESNLARRGPVVRIHCFQPGLISETEMGSSVNTGSSNVAHNLTNSEQNLNSVAHVAHAVAHAICQF